MGQLTRNAILRHIKQNHEVQCLSTSVVLAQVGQMGFILVLLLKRVVLYK